jgi:hypothetical protein
MPMATATARESISADYEPLRAGVYATPCSFSPCYSMPNAFVGEGAQPMDK